MDDLDDLEGMQVAIDFERVVEIWASSLGIRPIAKNGSSEISMFFEHGVAGGLIATPSQPRQSAVGDQPGQLAILHTPLFQRTWQLVVCKDVWGDEFKQFTRGTFDDVLFKKALAEVTASREAFSSRFFTLPDPAGARLWEVLRELRQAEQGQGDYDSDMLLLLTEFRCRSDGQPENKPPDCE